MKKLSCILLALSMSALLCACGNGTLKKLADVKLPPLPDFSEPAESVPPEPTEEETIMPEVSAESEKSVIGRITVNFETITEQYTDPEAGLIPILNYTVITPYFSIEGNDTAADRINSFIGAVNETCDTGDDYGLGKAFAIDRTYALACAEDNYTYYRSGGAEINPALNLFYSVTRSAKIENAHNGTISAEFDNIRFEQEMRSYKYAYSFSLKTGERLFLKDISTDLATLSKLIDTEMAGKYPELESSALDMAPYSDEYDGITWCFTQSGLRCFSDVLGWQQDVTVPYSKLENVLRSEFIPAENPNRGGTVTPSFLSDYTDGTSEIIDFVVQSDDGEDVLFNVTGEIIDVFLAESAYSESQGIYETRTLWYCSELSDCALQIKTLIPETVPYLKIKYAGNGQETSEFYLYQSGENGALLLVKP